MNLMTESYDCLVGFYNAALDSFKESLIEVQRKKRQQAVDLPCLFQTYVKSLDQISLSKSARTTYDNLNIEDLTHKIQAIVDNEQAALKKSKSVRRQVSLFFLCTVAFVVSSLAAAIFGSYSIAILLALGAGVICYKVTASVPFRDEVDYADKQIEAELRPINNLINEASLSATPKILRILREYNLPRIEFVGVE
ncbi:MAG: hypothetical protein ACXWM7_06130 [Parachlamydiaceae bacterium]